MNVSVLVEPVSVWTEISDCRLSRLTFCSFQTNQNDEKDKVILLMDRLEFPKCHEHARRPRAQTRTLYLCGSFYTNSEDEKEQKGLT